MDAQSIQGSFIGGALSAAITRLLLHPIDTCKVCIQGSNEPNLKFLSTASRLINDHGYKALFSGIGISTMGAVPAQCLYFGSYEIFKRYIPWESPTSFTAYFTCGILAEAVSCILWVPLDVIKERLQSQRFLHTYTYKNALHAMREIVRENTYKGLYKGYWSTLGTFGPCSGLYFFFYESLKNEFGGGGTLSLSKSLLFGCVSGALATAITSPLDLLKVRIQVQRNAMGGNDSWWDVLKKVVQRDGCRGLFRGWGARTMYCVPSMALGIGITEYVKGKYVSPITC